MLVILDVVLVGLIALTLWVAAWRGRARARRADARRAPDVADLIPRPTATDRDRRSAPAPRIVASAAAGPSTWSALAERGETAPPAAVAAAEPRPGRRVGAPRRVPPGVVVAPRGASWVVSRDGATRVSSVHASREAAEARGHKTARRERVVLEVRDGQATVIDRTDYAAGRVRKPGSESPEAQAPGAVAREPTP